MPDIESGMFIGSTSVNGAVSIKWGRHSTAPFAVFVTYAPNNNDSVTNSFTPLIWSVGDSDFQARLRETAAMPGAERNRSGCTGWQPGNDSFP